MKTRVAFHDEVDSPFTTKIFLTRRKAISGESRHWNKRAGVGGDDIAEICQDPRRIA